MWKALLISLAVGAAAGALLARSLNFACEPWKPVLEETSFRYLSEQAEQLGDAVGRTAAALRAGSVEDAAAALAEGQQVLAGLQTYYLPLTEVRQMVYDADRLFFLDESDEALEKLRGARETVHGLRDGQSAAIRKLADELVLAIEDVILAVENRSDRVAAKLGGLGHKVNLLVLRGALEL
jgi:hypothetical protein